ncbi:hypothetical protein ACFLQP_01460 [Acidobacteriota bacterium]
MKKIIFTILSILFTGFVLAVDVEIVPLPDLINPDGIQADRHRLYITEQHSIYIYSLKDFKLTKKFGKSGEGPQEFKVSRFSEGRIYIHLEPEVLLVNSLKKNSYFTKQGDFIKEIRTISGSRFIPIGSGFAAYGTVMENKAAYRAVNLHGRDLKKIKELYREEVGQMGKDINPLTLMKPLLFCVLGGKLLIGGKDGFIYVFDGNGNPLYSIRPGYEPVPFSREQQRKFELDFKTHPRFNSLYEVVKKQLKYPEYFPLMRYFHTADQKVYIRTYREVKGESEFFIFTIEGKLLKRVMLPVKEKDALESYPYTIENGKFYQLVENEQTEEWELHKVDISS